MFKKILLGVSTFAIAILLFAVYQWQDKTPRRVPEKIAPAQSPATQMEPDAKHLKVRGVDVPPGEKPFVVVYDDRGKPKILFRSDKWHPVTENEWHMTRPEVRLHLPGGQPIHATADEGQVVVAKEENDNYNPKRGWLRGNVHIMIDRTDEAWRQKHPDRPRPEQHPEYVFHLWLDDVRFDLDLARLESVGAIKVQSHDATVEGTGLVLAWNEVDRRIDLLEIAKGKRMELRRDAGFVEFAMPGSEREQRAPRTAAPTTAAAAVAPPPAPGTRPAGRAIEATTRPARRQGDALVVDLTKERSLRPRRNQIDTYQALFAGPVTVVQKRGETDLGKLVGDTLELLFDFGQAQRAAADAVPPDSAESAATRPTSDVPQEAQPKVELAWSGKLTLRPAAPATGKPAGDRFHAIATGHVVITKGASQAACDRMEFHNETEQAWLSGTPVRMRTNQGREMAGEKVFYDRRNGIARIDGPGSMTDPARALPDGVALPGSKGDRGVEEVLAGPADERAERAVIHWSKSAELQLGKTQRGRWDPHASRPAIYEVEYLRSARFSGGVKLSQPGRSLEGDEIVSLFAEPGTGGGVDKSAAEQFGRQIAEAVAVRPEARARLAEQVRDLVAQVLSAPSGNRDAPQQLGRAIAEAVGGTAETQRLNADRLSRATFELLSAESRSQATASEQLATMIAGLGPTRSPAEQAEIVRRLQGGLARLMVREPADQDMVVSDRLERMTARGGVRFCNRDDVVTADELLVMMTVDDNGRSVPATAEARGNVTARQRDRRITARDRLWVQLASVPAPGDPIDRPFMAARARAKGIDPATIDWEALETRRRNRRTVAVVRMHAFGDVRAVDPAEKLNLSADELRCHMPDGRQIEEASVVGAAGGQAEVELNDRYVRAPLVRINAKRQNAEVPSAGLLRFRSYEDLNGERLDQPVPVTISWSKSMTINGEENAGLFSGDVHAVSRDTVVDCRELHVAFADVREAPATAPATAPTDRYWILEPLVRRWNARADRNRSSRSLATGERKRAMRLVAVGDARALSTTTDPKDRARILSRMQIDGPQLVLDLQSDQLNVNGAGHLLIEDYRPPQTRPRAAAAVTRGVRDPFGSNLDAQRPNQTLFTWQNAMSFFARRELAVFDGDVTMTHLSGSAIKLAGNLAQAMKIDVASLQTMKGRRAGLRCENLIVEFYRDRARKRPDDVTPLAGATELRQFRATGRARLEEGTRSVEGDLVTFNRATGIIRVFGSPDAPAQMLDQDEASGRLYRWWGESVTHNLETGQTEADKSVVTATGR